jgi:hypothetical protein
MVALAHSAGLFQLCKVHEILHVERHPHPAQKLAAPVEFIEQFEGVEIAVHVMD